jgi:hypothetical protein
MSKEKLPEPSGWRERLDDPQELSAWGVSDKETAWDKLHARLGKSPRRIGAAWYWAAACLLAVAGLALLFREGHGGPGRNGVATGSTSTVRPAPSASEARQPARPSLTELQQEIRIAAPREGLKTRAGKKGRVRLPATATIAADAHRQAILVTHPIQGVPDSPRWIAQGELHPAKPMRVVHNNELDQAPGSSPSFAGSSSSRHWLKWRAAPGLYSAQDEPVPPAHPIITIHFSPKN